MQPVFLYVYFFPTPAPPKLRDSSSKATLRYVGNKLCASPSRNVFPAVFASLVNVVRGEPREVPFGPRPHLHGLEHAKIALNGGGRSFKVVISPMQVNARTVRIGLLHPSRAAPVLAYRTRFSELAAETSLIHQRAIENGTRSLVEMFIVLYFNRRSVL